MATYQSPKVAPTVTPRAGLDLTAVCSTFEPPVPLEMGDVIEMVKIPRRAAILQVSLAASQLDTANGLMLQVGDSWLPDQYIASSNVAQAGGIVQMSVPAGLGNVFVADGLITVSVAVPPTSWQNGLITVAVMYQMQF